MHWCVLCCVAARLPNTKIIVEYLDMSAQHVTEIALTTLGSIAHQPLFMDRTLTVHKQRHSSYGDLEDLEDPV